MYYLYAERFFLKDTVVGPGYLAIKEGRFGSFQTTQPTGEIHDYSGEWIAPGLVDTHIHGLANYDVMDNSAAGLEAICAALPSCGVTSFLPTTLTATEEQLTAVAATIRHVQKQRPPGAKIQGIYFEGPFFTADHKGAQNPTYFNNPSLSLFQKWQQAAEGTIKKIALAPEREEANVFITAVTQQGVTVALGHSAATYNEAVAAVSAGASVFVHTYNGMSGFNHREPGMVGAALTTKQTYCELICDGHHVHPVAADLLITVKTAQQTVLVTDCMRAGLMPDGDYILGELPVTVLEGVARLTSGSLAGSVLQLQQAVQNVVNWGTATVADALQMATYSAAQSCGIADVCGVIAPGYAADYIVLKTDLTLLKTYVDGNCVYERTDEIG